MVCAASCFITAALLGGLVLTNILGYKAFSPAQKAQLLASFSPAQSQRYDAIVKERRTLAMTGAVLGAVLAAVYFFLLASRTTSTPSKVCKVGAITLGTMYFYYTLSPKSDHMVKHLVPGQQMDDYLALGRSMELRWNAGLLLGGAACLVLGM